MLRNKAPEGVFCDEGIGIGIGIMWSLFIRISTGARPEPCVEWVWAMGLKRGRGELWPSSWPLSACPFCPAAQYSLAS